MPYEQKPGQGSLFRNKKHVEGDKLPSMKGTALVQVGTLLAEIEIAGWKRESEKAGKWLSLSVKCKSVRPQDDMGRAGMGEERF